MSSIYPVVEQEEPARVTGCGYFGTTSNYVLKVGRLRRANGAGSKARGLVAFAMHLFIIIPDDELKRLEKRFGPCVRQMGSSTSDGIFSYSSVPIVAIEEAAESLNDPIVAEAVFRLKQAPERTKPFIELVQSFGPSLIEKIAAAYRQRFLEPLFHRKTRG